MFDNLFDAHKASGEFDAGYAAGVNGRLSCLPFAYVWTNARTGTTAVVAITIPDSFMGVEWVKGEPLYTRLKVGE